jgi:hypothetical protein
MCKWSITYIIMYKQINNSTHHCTSTSGLLHISLWTNKLTTVPITVLLLSTQIIDFFYNIWKKKKIRKKIEKWTATTTEIYNNVSKWLLFNSEIFQLHHGKDKLIFNEMMMSSTLY